MTRNELNILYNLRKQAYSMNQVENMFKYIVVDLSIITLKNPQPLRVKQKQGYISKPQPKITPENNQS